MKKSFKLSESLSIVIPSYNEEANISNVIEETVREAKKISRDFEVVIVNDGSTDKTGAIADMLAKKYSTVKVIHHKKNLGLAQAWKTGIASCTKDIILYIEGDGQQPLKDQYDLLKKIQHADIALGTRSDRFDYSLFRKILSYGYLFLIRLLFQLPYKDVGWSQAYRRKIFDAIEMKSITPFFDTEVIIKARRNGYNVVEARSVYRSRSAGFTTLGNIKTAYAMFIEMIKMRFGFLD